jgi:hypothetical protein
MGDGIVITFLVVAQRIERVGRRGQSCGARRRRHCNYPDGLLCGWQLEIQDAPVKELQDGI